MPGSLSLAPGLGFISSFKAGGNPPSQTRGPSCAGNEGRPEPGPWVWIWDALRAPFAVPPLSQGHGTAPGCENAGNIPKIPRKGHPGCLCSLWKHKEREGGAQNKHGALRWVGCEPPGTTSGKTAPAPGISFLSPFNLGAPAAPCRRCREGTASLLMWKRWVCSAPQVLLLGGGSRRPPLPLSPPLHAPIFPNFRSRNVRLRDDLRCKEQRSSHRLVPVPAARSSSESSHPKAIFFFPQRFFSASRESDLFINNSAALLEG